MLPVTAKNASSAAISAATIDSQTYSWLQPRPVRLKRVEIYTENGQVAYVDLAFATTDDAKKASAEHLYSGVVGSTNTSVGGSRPVILYPDIRLEPYTEYRFWDWESTSLTWTDLITIGTSATTVIILIFEVEWEA